MFVYNDSLALNPLEAIQKLRRKSVSKMAKRILPASVEDHDHNRHIKIVLVMMLDANTHI